MADGSGAGCWPACGEDSGKRQAANPQTPISEDSDATTDKLGFEKSRPEVGIGRDRDTIFGLGFCKDRLIAGCLHRRVSHPDLR